MLNASRLCVCLVVAVSIATLGCSRKLGMAPGVQEAIDSGKKRTTAWVQACKGGDSKSCDAACTDDFTRYEDRAAVCEKACDADLGRSCDRRGDQLVDVDPTKAMAAYQKACHQNVARSCDRAAGLVARFPELKTSIDLNARQEALIAGCQREEMSSCNTLARAFLLNYNLRHDPEDGRQAVAHYQRVCGLYPKAGPDALFGCYAYTCLTGINAGQPAGGEASDGDVANRCEMAGLKPDQARIVQ